MKYFINNAEIEDIYNHLYRCREDFIPSLEKYVNINKYSEKIRNNATTIEAWNEHQLVGLVAIYLNDLQGKMGFITSVSVENSYSGLGIGQELLRRCIEIAISMNYVSVKLEVNENSVKAISLYNKFGFFKKSKQRGILEMELDLKQSEIKK